MTGAMAWMAQQLAAAGGQGGTPSRPAQAHNPRPPGQVCDHGTTRLVLRYLLTVERQSGQAWVRRCEIVAAVAAPEQRIDAALRFLRRTGRVLDRPDESRRGDGLWRIYRASEAALAAGDNL